MHACKLRIRFILLRHTTFLILVLPGTVLATALAAITSLKMVFFSEDDEPILCHVVIFFVKFIGEGHAVVEGNG